MVFLADFTAIGLPVFLLTGRRRMVSRMASILWVSRSARGMSAV